MAEIFIKYFSIIYCTIYTYAKLSNLRHQSNLNLIINIFFSALLSLLNCQLGMFFPHISIFIIFYFCSVYITFSTKARIRLSLRTICLSLCISYIAFILLTIFFSAIFESLGITLLKSNTFLLCFITIAQILSIYLLFKIKRLKNGMPFLSDDTAVSIGVLISIFVLFCALVLNINTGFDIIYTLPVALIILSTVLILIWWYNQITRTYLKRLKNKEMQEMQKKLDEQQEKIKNLEFHNDALAKIIHRDNKIVPAMLYAVNEYLLFLSTNSNDTRLQKYQELVIKLDELAADRNNIISKYVTSNKKLPLTNVNSIDIIFSYLLNKAAKNNIDFNLTIFANTQLMINSIISENDLNTLLADIIDNAIIASQEAKLKNILVNIGLIGDFYFFDVIDSGIPFEIETMVNLGLGKATTHANEGGNGIGLMTTFEILKRYHASFIIEELTNINQNFTKKVSVIFDFQEQYIIKSPRADEIRKLSNRNDLVTYSL